MRSSAFNFSNPLVPVRIMLGLLFVPHIAFKVADIAGATAFFARVGFRPAVVFVWLAIAMESISAICLIFGILTKWTGLLAAGVMFTAILAVLSIKAWCGSGISAALNTMWCGRACVRSSRSTRGVTKRSNTAATSCCSHIQLTADEAQCRGGVQATERAH